MSEQKDVQRVFAALEIHGDPDAEDAAVRVLRRVGDPTKIFIDYQDNDVESVPWHGRPIPRIGESVGSRPMKGQREGYFHLDYVVAVRHYPGEVRVMTSSRR